MLSKSEAARVRSGCRASSGLTTLPRLRKAVRLANDRERPGEADLLLRDGRAAARRGQYRRAVIDAGAAAELALAAFNRSGPKLKPKKGQHPTLGWYVKKLKSQAGLSSTTESDLVHVRNAAIHKNKDPGPSRSSVALAIAKQIVDKPEPRRI